MPLYIATRKLRIGEGDREPGELVPEFPSLPGRDSLLARGEVLVLSDAALAAIRGERPEKPRKS